MSAGDVKVETLEDIARLAGVSRSTVSRALRDSSLISEKTRARIQAIAREHDYRPNQLARSLRLKRTQTVAFVIPIEGTAPDYFSDPFLLKFIGLVSGALRESDYDMLISQPPAGESDIVDRYVASGRADGLILMGRSSGNDRLLARTPADTPVVLWGPPLPGERFCSVGINNVAAAREAAGHLLQQGRRRLAFIGKQDGCLEAVHRYEGYLQALTAYGHPLDEALVASGDYSGRSGYEGMLAILEQAPDVDAVFANSDVLALGALEILRQNGRRVPDDVALVGFDNISQGAYASPPLTTVSQNLTGAGAALLVERLLQQIAGQKVRPAMVPYRLIVRASSGAV